MSKNIQCYVVIISRYNDFTNELESGNYFSKKLEHAVQDLHYEIKEIHKRMNDLGYSPIQDDCEFENIVPTYYELYDYIQKHWQYSLSFINSHKYTMKFLYKIDVCNYESL